PGRPRRRGRRGRLQRARGGRRVRRGGRRLRRDTASRWRGALGRGPPREHHQRLVPGRDLGGEPPAGRQPCDRAPRAVAAHTLTELFSPFGYVTHVTLALRSSLPTAD